MRRSLGCDDALDLTFAELRAVLRHPLRHAVAHERGGRGAARCDAHPAADQDCTERRRPVLRQLLPRLQHDRWIDAAALALEREAFLHRYEDFAEAEKAD